MKVFLQICDDVVVIRARAESAVDGELCVGDYVQDVSSGGNFGGLSYERLRVLGSGEYDLDELLSHADVNASGTLGAQRNREAERREQAHADGVDQNHHRDD